MKSKPDFFLTAVGEAGPGSDLSRVRACWAKGRLRSRFSDQLMWIEVDPPLMAQEVGSEGLGELVISARFEGDVLFPVSKWPLHVCLYRILDSRITESRTITKPDEAELLFWGELYRTRKDAQAEVRRHPMRYP